MVTVRFDNCGILTKMGDSSTHTGALIPPVDGTDFPHTGLIKLFDAQRYGYAILNDNVTTGSDSSTAGSVFDKNFNIGMDDTSNSGRTTVAVMAGSIIRNGLLVNVSTGASVGVGKHITEILSGSPSDEEFIEQGTSGQNFYHVIVVNSSNTVKIRNPSAQDKVADLLAGDIPIAILRVQNGESKTARQIQYLGTDRRDGGLSIYHTNSNVPTEALQISSSAGDTTIENKVSDKDIIFKVNDGGVSREILRLDADDNEVRIVSTIDGAGMGPQLTLFRDTADADDNDLIGLISFKGEDSTNAETEYIRMVGQILDESNGSEDAQFFIRMLVGGTLAYPLKMTPTQTIFNANNEDIDVRIDGATDNLFYADSSADKIGIGHSSPDATLDLLTGGTFRNTRLLTVSVSAGTTLTEAAHAGRYNICAGNVTLPSTSTAGEHYAILNTTGGDITIGRNGRNINGAGSDVTLATYKAATCIAIGSNNWIVIGV